VKAVRRWGLVLLMLGGALAAPALTLNELQVWAGTGTNRAALVIAWPAPAPASVCPADTPSDGPTLAWGFRWNGTATAADLLRAVLETDRRLFVLTAAEQPAGTVVVGLGLDANQNERFGLRGPDRWLLPDSFAQGPVSISPAELRGLQPLELGDWYAAAWDTHDWQVWREAGESGGFDTAPPLGAWTRVLPVLEACPLQDGSWIALSWAPRQQPRAPTGIGAAPAVVRPFATTLLAARGPFGPPPYDDPVAVLGVPTRWFYDPWAVFSGREPMRRASVVEPPFNLSAPQGEPLLLTLPPGSSIIVGFDPPLTNDPAHPYGVDFLVFGNAFYAADGVVGDEADLNRLRLTGGRFEEPLLVSVSPGFTGAPGEREDDPDSWQWYTYESGPYADTAFPTQAFLWDWERNGWGPEPTDFTLPVNPALSAWLMAGRWSVLEVMEWYGCSAGGTGFDLGPSGFAAVRFVKIEGRAPDRAWGEVDAVSRVRPLTLGEGLWVFPENLAAGEHTVWFQNLWDPKQWAVQVRLGPLNQPVWLGAAPAGDWRELLGKWGCAVAGVRLEVRSRRGDQPAALTGELRLRVPQQEIQQGHVLDLWILDGAGSRWSRPDFVVEAESVAVRLAGLTNSTTIVVVRVSPPQLQVFLTGGRVQFEFRPVPNWVHALERTVDWRSWTVVREESPTRPEPLLWEDPQPPDGAAFYRLRLSPR
jgi:hypothetical protein